MEIYRHICLFKQKFIHSLQASIDSTNTAGLNQTWRDVFKAQVCRCIAATNRCLSPVKKGSSEPSPNSLHRRILLEALSFCTWWVGKQASKHEPLVLSCHRTFFRRPKSWIFSHLDFRCQEVTGRFCQVQSGKAPEIIIRASVRGG